MYDLKRLHSVSENSRERSLRRRKPDENCTSRGMMIGIHEHGSPPRPGGSRQEIQADGCLACSAL
jgi:hypothetical protein